MAAIHVAGDLWTTGMPPAGISERWLIPDRATVRAGQAAEVRAASYALAPHHVHGTNAGAPG